MFRRAVITDEISQDLAHAVSMARDYGLEGVELRNVWGKRIDQLDSDELARARRIVEDAGLSVAGIAPPLFKATLGDSAEYQEHLAILERSFAAARALGCNIIRAFTFWKDRPLEEAWAQVLDLWQEPARRAEREGIILAIENEASCFVGTGAQLARFLCELGASSQVRALWDPGNAYCEGETVFPDGYQSIREDIVHVHMKDCVTVDQPRGHRWVVVGEGEIDWRGQLRALVADGFDGYVSLETHYRRTPLGDEALRLPSGERFSEEGALASAECLESWNRIMRDL